MGKVLYQEIQTASAVNRVQGMEFKWSFNPYQGCAHGCHYCFARRYHFLRDQDPGDQFSGTVMVKVNAPEALERDLSRPSWKRDTVAVGTATDPYQPVEGKYRITRRCLEVFCRKRNPVGIVTKGTMLIRDLDLLTELSRRAACTVCFSITTLDEGLRRKLEPGTPPAQKRLQVMEKLVAAGVNAGVILAPIIPGITDSPSNLEEVAKAAAHHGARFLSSNVLNLKEGTKEHFFSFLQKEYPSLAGTYRRLYPGPFASRYLTQTVQSEVARLKRTYDLHERTLSAEMPAGPRQLQLAL